MKKTLSIILAILMVVTMLPMTVLPASAASEKQDGFTVYATYGVCKYCGDKHAADDVNIKSISVENGKVTFQLSVSFKNRGDCSKTANVKAYSGVNTTTYYFTYTITDDFSCEQSYLINESYGQDFGEDKPKLLYSISRKEGHQSSSWTFNGTKHSGTCELCGKKVNDNCSGGTATCMEKATCSTCGNKYGSLASDNHDWSNLDGICANGCGAECSHKWGEGVLTRPTKTEEGYYTYTCSACGATKTEVAVRAANYAEYTNALNNLRAYLDSDKLTDDAKASVAEWLEIYDSDEAYKFIAGEEETVTLYIEAALYYATEIEAAIQDCLAGNHSGNGEYCDICGAALHICDFSGEWKYDSEKHWKECSCGVSNTASAHTYIDGACECGYKCPHEWVGVAFAKPTRTEEGYYTYTCSVCKSTKTEPVERASNYAEFKELLEKVKGYLDENLTDSMMQEVNNVINFFELDENHGFIKGEENNVSQMIRQISGFVEVVEEGIADGTAVKVNGKAIVNKMLDEWGEKIKAEGLVDAYIEFVDNNKATEEAIAEDDEIQKFAESLEGSVAENADNIKQLEGMVSEFLACFENCLNGAHNVREYKVIEAAKCGENAVEEGACWFCGEIVTREAEDTALTHSFTKYEVTEEAKCGVAGKEVAYCDHGCGETDEKAIDALTHKDADGDYKCDNGCGHEFEKPAPEEPTDRTCDHLCHKGGFMGFIWKIVQFFWKLFKANPTCECGAAHY